MPLSDLQVACWPSFGVLLFQKPSPKLCLLHMVLVYIEDLLFFFFHKDMISWIRARCNDLILTWSSPKTLFPLRPYLQELEMRTSTFFVLGEWQKGERH
jgi:hypothetical protein